MLGLAALIVVATIVPQAASVAVNVDEVDLNCTLKNHSALSRFQFETFYSWHTAVGNWTNVGQASDWQELVTYYNLTGRGSIFELYTVFWESMKVKHPHLQGLTIRSDWRARWNHTANLISKFVEQGVIIGFMLGDELVWNNITWDQLNETSALVKATFPNCFVFYNEGGAPLYGDHNVNHYKIHYPFVPFAVDYVSTDDYDSMYIHKNARWFYESFLYPKIKFAHQRAWVVPPVYAKYPSNITESDDYAYLEAIAYFDWIDHDDRLHGLDGFYLNGPHSLLTLPKTLKCYQTLAAQMIAHEGKR